MKQSKNKPKASKWTTKITETYESEFGKVWYDIGCWWAETATTETTYCYFKTKQEAQQFLEKVYDLDNKAQAIYFARLYRMIDVAKDMGIKDISMQLPY